MSAFRPLRTLWGSEILKQSVCSLGSGKTFFSIPAYLLLVVQSSQAERKTGEPVVDLVEQIPETKTKQLRQFPQQYAATQER